MDAFLTLFLQLPLGILFAAGLLECFVVFKDRRDAEPAVLWLLFCASIMALICGGVHFLQHGSWDYSLFVGLASGLTAIGWWFKRSGRNRGVTNLSDRFMVAGSYAPVKMPNQDLYVLGYRGALVGAAVLAGFALFNGRVLEMKTGSGALASTDPAAVPPAPAPVAPVTPAVTEIPPETVANNGGTETPPDKPAEPETEKPTETPTEPMKEETPPAVVEGTPAPPPAEGTPAPAEGTPAPAEGTPATPTPAPAPTPVVAVADFRPVSKNSIFGSKIRPIIQRYCVTCHGAEKQKGDLRLDTPDFIRNGVRGKPVILAGKPAQSGLLQSITKPPGDEDRMPPKGDGVSPADAALIKKWIESGADMGDGVSTASSGAASFAEDALGAALQAPPPALIEELKKDGVLVRPVSKDGKVLEIDFSHSDYGPGQIKLERLAPIAMNVHTLDLSRTKITDEDLVTVGKMGHLTRLILSRTATTDVGLGYLKTCSQLDYINIYQTKVTDAGLTNLESLAKLRKVYAWQSMVTAAGAASLQGKIPGVAVNTGQ